MRPGQFVNAAEAARRLGVSPKALRLYEQRGLLVPDRNAAGWREYGPEHLARAAEIVALRQLGLGLGQVARVLEGDPRDLEPALARHEAVVEGQIRDLSGVAEKLRVLRAKLADGAVPAPGELLGVLETPALAIAFDLPCHGAASRSTCATLGASPTSPARSAAARRDSPERSPRICRVACSSASTGSRLMDRRRLPGWRRIRPSRPESRR